MVIYIQGTAAVPSTTADRHTSPAAQDALQYREDIQSQPSVANDVISHQTMTNHLFDRLFDIVVLHSFKHFIILQRQNRYEQ